MLPMTLYLTLWEIVGQKDGVKKMGNKEKWIKEGREYEKNR